MAQSVRIQEPYLLTPHPYTVGLPKRISLSQRDISKPQPTKKEKTKERDISSKRSLPQGFLAASVPEHFFGDDNGDHSATVVTVQGAAIYLYDLARQQCLHSWSVPPGHLFVSPARYLPAQGPNTGSLDITSIDADTDADLSLSSSLAGNVFAVIDCGADVAEREEKRLVWMWKVAEVRGDTEEVTLVAGKPDSSKKFKNEIYHLATFIPSPSAKEGYLVLVHIDGGITVTSRTLETVTTWSAPSTTNARVVWSTTFTTAEEGEEEWRSLRVLSIVQHERGLYTIRTHSVSAKRTGVVHVELLSEVEMSVPVEHMNTVKGQEEVPVIPMAFAYQVERDVLTVVYSNAVVRVYQFESGISKVLRESLSFTLKQARLELPSNLNSHRARGPSSISISPLDASYISIVGYRRRKDAGVEEVLTIWDTEYGALHYEKVWNATGNEVGASSRVFHTTVIKSPLTGPVISVASSVISHHSPVSFSSTVTFIPYHCSPLTMLSVLGKLRKPLLANGADSLGSKLEGNVIEPAGLGMATVGLVSPPVAGPEIESWNTQLADSDQLSREYVAKLLDPAVNEGQFNKLFCEWMQKKLLELRELENEEGKGKRDPVATQSTEPKVNGVVPKKGKKQEEQQKPDTDVDQTQALPKYLTCPPDRSVIAKLPRVELSYPALFTILRRCFSNPTKFWPRHTIQYLLRSGCATSRSVEGGIIGAALEREDLYIIQDALKHVSDLGENELVEVLRYVCGAEEGRWKNSGRTIRAKKLADWLESKEKNVRKSRQVVPGTPHPERMKVAEWQSETEEEDKANDVEVNGAEEAEKLEQAEQRIHQAEVSSSALDPIITTCTPGQAHFFRLVFSRPRTDTFMAQAMQKRLGARDLGTILGWVSNVLKVNEGEDEMDLDGTRPALWWMWADEKSTGNVGPQPGSFAEWATAIDTLTLLLDAHISTLLHARELESLLQTLHQTISYDTTRISILNSRLLGPLHGIFEEKKREVEQREKGKGKRWRRMVEDVRGEEYEVEIYKF
ncbi:hypothetical protein SpCBS45565_g04829 [Spizellomyces sp. 'palustris']|nr:hypothetical protein SpCBS45565_g04829 [Spizellomyces sp. 'palustris']